MASAGTFDGLRDSCGGPTVEAGKFGAGLRSSVALVGSTGSVSPPSDNSIASPSSEETSIGSAIVFVSIRSIRFKGTAEKFKVCAANSK